MNKNFYFLILVAMVFTVSGCGISKHAMKRAEMYAMPAAEGTFTVVTFRQDPELFLSESLYGTKSHKAVLFSADGQKLGDFIAISVPTGKIEMLGGQPIRQRALEILVNRPKADLPECSIGVLDHAGRVIFNAAGQARQLESGWSQINYASIADHVTPISEANAKEYVPGTPEYEELSRLLSGNAIMAFRDYFGDRYGYQAMTAGGLSERDLDRIAESDTVTKRFWSWLKKDIKLMFFINPFAAEAAIFNAAIAKIMDLNQLWSMQLDQPGYADYKLSARDGANMILQYHAGLSVSGGVGGGETDASLTAEEAEVCRSMAQQAGIDCPCQTVEDYNRSANAANLSASRVAASANNVAQPYQATPKN